MDKKSRPFLFAIVCVSLLFLSLGVAKAVMTRIEVATNRTEASSLLNDLRSDISGIKCDTTESEFHYGDKIEITNGFYTGHRGVVTDRGESGYEIDFKEYPSGLSDRGMIWYRKRTMHSIPANFMKLIESGTAEL